MISAYSIIFVTVATIIGAVGSLFLKKGANNLNLGKILNNKFLILGLGLYCISTIIYIFALKMGELSIIYPLTALSYIWTSILSIKFLKEKMNLFKWSGILLIISGIIFIVK